MMRINNDKFLIIFYFYNYYNETSINYFYININSKK